MRLLTLSLLLLVGCGSGSSNLAARYDGEWVLTNPSEQARSDAFVNYRSERDYDGMFTDSRFATRYFFYVNPHRQDEINIVFDGPNGLSSRQTRDFSIQPISNGLRIEWELSGSPFDGTHTFTVHR